ncbi:MAG: hypothetical protein A4E28_00010 [Methanocella sp. PtaU1.Bin125]|nr:MAG: hypothetical protein A4E28_00010 [Methanocella sp. PtaU1.Bin125]
MPDIIPQITPEQLAVLEAYRKSHSEQAESSWDEYWRRHLDKDFYSAQDGQHMLVTGNTGAGKTQFLLNLVNDYLKKTDHIIVWLDCGKSSELANLGRMKKLRVYVPEGCDMEIRVSPDYMDEWKGHEIIKFRPTQMTKLWKGMSNKYINVISLLPYILTNVTMYVDMIGKLFSRLVVLAQREELTGRIELFCDEFHLICPEKVNQLSDDHYQKGTIVVRNAEMIRSCGIGLKAAAPAVTKVRQAIRQCFTWRGIGRGTRFLDDDDLPLKENNKLWIGLKPGEFFIADPNKRFTDKPVKVKYWGEGRDVAHVRYIGTLNGESDEPLDEAEFTEVAEVIA